MLRIALTPACLLFTLSLFAPTASAAVLAYEGFDYPNDGSSLLAGMNGGSGWGDAWVFSGAAADANAGFDVSQDDASLDSTAFPFTPIGDRLLAAGLESGSNTARADRVLTNTFDLNAEGGVRYVSFLMQKDGSDVIGTAGNNMELDLTPGGIRLGSTSGNQFFLNVAGNTFGEVTLGETHFVVLKLESHVSPALDVASAIAFGSADIVPTTEPTTWGASNEFDSSAISDTLRLWIGTNADGQFDEIRVGESWADVTSPAAPTHPGDFDGDGDVDGADFVAWQTNFPKAENALLSEGDADGDGDVDGADFVVWQTNFPFTPGSGASPVPEPESFVLAVLGTGVFLALKPRGRSPWAWSRRCST